MPQPTIVAAISVECWSSRGSAGSGWLNGLLSAYGRQQAPGMFVGEANVPNCASHGAVFSVVRVVLVPVGAGAGAAGRAGEPVVAAGTAGALSPAGAGRDVPPRLAGLR